MSIVLDGTTGITTPGLTNTGTETLVNLTTTGNTTLGDATTDTLTVGVTGIVKDASGNVGIGTASPVTKLHLQSSGGSASNQWSWFAGNTGGATPNASITAGIALGNNYSGGGTEGNVIFGTYLTFAKWDGTTYSERMRIDSSGNVGIGQSSITQQFANYTQLNISGSSGATIQMQSGATNRTNIVADANGLYIASLSGYTVFSNGGTGTGTERMRIDASGNLLLNTTGQVAQGKFSVSFVGSTNQAASFNESSGAASWTTVLFQRLGTTIGSISNATSSTAYNTSSDYRLKNTIAPMTGALAKVQALKPVTYKWNIDDEAGEGFIAHELAEVCPHAVTGEKDAVDADGNPIYQGIDTSFLVATLTAAIQEQQALITALTARIEALETK